MHRHKIPNLLIGLLVGFISISALAAKQSVTIGFGSCASQERAQPIWKTIASHQPDWFILTGDNVYIDSPLKDDMLRAYQQFSEIPEFKAFRSKVPVIGTWDDHDYGENDAGRSFQSKHLAKQAFIDFFNYPEVKQLQGTDRGIYHSKWLKHDDLTVQIILLDTRWNRTDLTRSYLSDEQRKSLSLGPYQPNPEGQGELLGKDQWQWLEQQLAMPADVKLLVSSIQVLPEYSGWELWANFPHERTRLLNMLDKYTLDNLLIISGDVHRGELTQYTHKNRTYYEVTSSGLAAKVYPAAPNKYRVEEALIQQNYGIIDIQADEQLIKVKAQLFDDNAHLFQQFNLEIKRK